jgi:hypothetical protein
MSGKSKLRDCRSEGFMDGYADTAVSAMLPMYSVIAG